MNNSYYETLDENFTQALNLYEQNYSQKELFELLKSGNIVQKQIAAIRIETISSEQEASIFLQNLTGQDGKIREVVSLRLKEFMENSELVKFFNPILNHKIFLDAIIDINGNICRNIICAIKNLKTNEGFCQVFCKNLTILTNNLLDKIEKFDFQEGKYKVNKEVFKLYWCLEAIYELWDKIEFEELKNILLRSKDIPEYTIREKVAKILKRDFSDLTLEKAKSQLKSDDNYYVRLQ